MSIVTDDVLLTEVETAAVISCSLSALQKSRSKQSTKIIDGEAPTFIKDKGKIRYRLEDLERFVKNLKQHRTIDRNSDSVDIEPVNDECETTVRKPMKEEVFDWSRLKS